MNILLVAATDAELAPFEQAWFRKNRVNRLVGGVGMVATAHSLTRELVMNKYDLILNIGLAGAFNRELRIGEVVRVTEDIFSELGAEDGEMFLRLEEIGLKGTDIFLNLDEEKNPLFSKYRSVRGITVNMIHGNEESIKQISRRLHPDIETMEGAAFFYVCGKENIPSVQLRAISNYVERRNKNSWNIPLAMQHLKEEVFHLLESL